MSTAAIILAAGLGTRLKSSIPKVMQPLLGKPMVHYVLDAVKTLKPASTVVVVNPAHREVREAASFRGADIAVQKTMLGTAHAVRCGMRALRNFEGDVLVLNGDVPLLTAKTLKKFLGLHKRAGADVSVLSFLAGDPHSYGRIVRDPSGRVLRIVEENDLAASERSIREVNGGVYALSRRAVGSLEKIRKNPAKKEYYLTDIVAAALKDRLSCKVFSVGTEAELRGVNTFVDLALVERFLMTQAVNMHMLRGARFLDPASVIVHADVRIGPDTIIYPNVILEGETVIGRSAIMYPGVRIVSSTLGENVRILDGSLVEHSTIGAESVVGPFAHLRPGTRIGRDVKIGNFVELKNASVSDGTKAAHLSYLGDAEIGKGVNIGAGTITCNYDGVRKHRTVIGDGVFVGSDSQLVAPVRIGNNAYIAAGSTITKDVSPGALGISRVRQEEIRDWTARRSGKGKK